VVLCALYVWCCVVYFVCVVLSSVGCVKTRLDLKKPMVMATLSLSTKQRKRTVIVGDEVRIQPL
jgi:hypothetical protein